MVDKIIIQESPGLLKVTKELLDSNREVVKQVTESNKSTLAKSFADNAAEIISDQLGQKKDAKRDKDAQKLSQKMAANVRNLDTTAKGIKYDRLGKPQRPAPGDTSFGQDANIERQNVAYRAETLQAMDKQNESTMDLKKIGESERAAKEKEAKAAEEQAQQGVVNNSFLGSLVQSFTGVESAVSVLKNIETKKAKLKDVFTFSKFRNFIPKTLKVFSLDANKNMKAIVGGLLGKTLGMFKVFNKKNGQMLLKGIKSGFNTLKSALGGVFGPFKRILQAIGAVLLVGGLFAFFNSDTWKKMKPNIAEFIGKALQNTEKALTFLGTFLKGNLNPAMGMFFRAIRATTDFLIEYLIPGMDKGNNKRADRERQVRADMRLPTGNDDVVKAEVDRRAAIERENYIAGGSDPITRLKENIRRLAQFTPAERAKYEENLGKEFDFNEGSGYRSFNPLSTMKGAAIEGQNKYEYLDSGNPMGNITNIFSDVKNEKQGDTVLNSLGQPYADFSSHSRINTSQVP